MSFKKQADHEFKANVSHISKLTSTKDSKLYKREKSGHQYENSNLCIIWCDR